MLNKKEYIDSREHDDIYKKILHDKYWMYYYLPARFSHINPRDYGQPPNYSSYKCGEPTTITDELILIADNACNRNRPEILLMHSLEYETYLYIYWLESLKQLEERFVFDDEVSRDVDNGCVDSILGCINCGNHFYYLQYDGEHNICRCCYNCRICMPIEIIEAHEDYNEYKKYRTSEYINWAQEKIKNYYHLHFPYDMRCNWSKSDYIKPYIYTVGGMMKND